MDAALYCGVVTHRRFSPRPHALRYRVFQLLVDLDAAPAVARRLCLFSIDRFNLISHHEADHGDGRPGRLRAFVEATLAEAGIDMECGRILLLAMPRMFGFVFNPLSLYFCFRPDGALAAVIYEVNNTFGQRHFYVTKAGPPGQPLHRTCAKAFHVSPFLPMDLDYSFTLTPPGETVATRIDVRDRRGALVLTAAFAGERRPLTDRALLAALVRFPLLTVKVVAAIHLEALKLWLKGVRLQPAPPDPAAPLTKAY